MVDKVPQSGVPANSVHTGGRIDDVDGRAGRSDESVGMDESVGKAGNEGSSVESIGSSVDAVVGVVDALVDAPAPVTPKPIAPKDNEAPASEAVSTRKRPRMFSPFRL
jgi:hypothetical protein